MAPYCPRGRTHTQVHTHAGAHTCYGRKVCECDTRLGLADGPRRLKGRAGNGASRETTCAPAGEWQSGSDRGTGASALTHQAHSPRGRKVSDLRYLSLSGSEGAREGLDPRMLGVAFCSAFSAETAANRPKALAPRGASATCDDHAERVLRHWMGGTKGSARPSIIGFRAPANP